MQFDPTLEQRLSVQHYRNLVSNTEDAEHLRELSNLFLDAMLMEQARNNGLMARLLEVEFGR